MNIKPIGWTIFIFIPLLLYFSPEGVFAQKKTTGHPQTHQKPVSPQGQKKKTEPAPPQYQNKNVVNFTTEQIEGFREQSSQMVKFFEGTLNFLADKSNLVKEKQTIITESYLKIFWDEKVQVEDDLDEKRLVPLYKDIPAYLTDVDFFFKHATFLYTVQDVSVMTNDAGQTYFKVTTNRNLTGVTVNGDSVNSNKVRYFEINYEDTKQQLKIVSIYTTKMNENDDMRNWWNGLAENWKAVFGKDRVVNDTLKLSQITVFKDSVAQSGNTEFKVDGARIYSLLLQVISQKQLDLSGNSSISDLSPLSKLSSLTSVNIANTQAADLLPLSNLNNLQELDISGTKVRSLEPLKYATHLRVLKMKKTEVPGISMVAGFTALEVLDISSTTIDSLEALKDLTSLKDLRCQDTRISRLGPLAGLINLEMLNISNTAVSDLNPLANLKKLQVLSFNNTKVKEITVLENLTSLSRIYCDNTLVDLSTVLRFKNKRPDMIIVFESESLSKWWGAMSPDWKKVFNLYTRLNEPPTPEQLHQLIIIDSVNINGRMSITSLEPLEKLTELRLLECNNTSVENLDPLKNLVKLIRLKATGTKVSDLTPLKELENLELLDIDNTPVNEITPLNDHKKLKFIFADNTGITLAKANQYIATNPECLVIFQTYENNSWWKGLNEPWKEGFQKQLGLPATPDKIQLQRIANLESLTIKENMQITSLIPVMKLSRLKELEVSDTRVADLGPLSNMKQLEKLAIPKNPVSDLKSIANLTQLKELDFSNTQIEDLEIIQNLVNLEVLKFSGTPVKNLKYLLKFVHLKKLEFYNTKVSNIDVLDNLHELTSLMIFNTKISAKKVEKFKTTHPKCEVVFY